MIVPQVAVRHVHLFSIRLRVKITLHVSVLADNHKWRLHSPVAILGHLLSRLDGHRWQVGHLVVLALAGPRVVTCPQALLAHRSVQHRVGLGRLALILRLPRVCEQDRIHLLCMFIPQIRLMLPILLLLIRRHHRDCRDSWVRRFSRVVL